MAQQKVAGWATPYTFTEERMVRSNFDVEVKIKREPQIDFAACTFSELMRLHYFGARYLDSRLSMWFGVDPLAGKGPWISPYSYSFNNSIRFIDSDGRWPFPTNTVNRIRRELGHNSIWRSISTAIPIESVSFGSNCIEVCNRIVKNVLFDNNQKG